MGKQAQIRRLRRRVRAVNGGDPSTQADLNLLSRLEEQVRPRTLRRSGIATAPTE